MVSNTVFLVVSIVGMGRSEEASHVLIVLRMVVGIAHQEPDGSPGGLPLEDPAEQFHLISFLSRCRNLALSGTTAVELCLDESHVDINTCWHTVDDTTDGLTMTLAKGRQSEYRSKCIHSSLITIHYSLITIHF